MTAKTKSKKSTKSTRNKKLKLPARISRDEAIKLMRSVALVAARFSREDRFYSIENVATDAIEVAECAALFRRPVRISRGQISRFENSFECRNRLREVARKYQADLFEVEGFDETTLALRFKTYIPGVAGDNLPNKAVKIYPQKDTPKGAFLPSDYWHE